MAATLQLLPAAIAEARAARVWYLERNREAANAFVVELDHAIANIAQAPERWPAYLYGTRRFVFRRFPFLRCTGYGASRLK